MPSYAVVGEGLCLNLIVLYELLLGGTTFHGMHRFDI